MSIQVSTIDILSIHCCCWQLAAALKDINIIVMKVRERKNKDEFEIPNKNRIKVLKKERKENLRSNRILSKTLIESPENSDDEEYQEKLVNRGSEWWGKVNHRFFRELSEEEVQALMDKTTSEELLNLKYPAKELENYFQEQIVSTNPFLASPCFLKVLFRREVKLDRYEHYELVTYSFKEYDYLREKPCRIIDRNIHLSSFRYPVYERVDYEGLELDKLEIDIIDVEDNQLEIKKLLHYDVVSLENKNEVDKEVELWGLELERTNQGNLGNWGQMVERMGAAQREPQVEEEIAEIKKELRMTEVLLYFKRGHSDKTEQMLEDALEVAMIKEMNMKEELKKKRNTKIEKLKCLFETDCKICFCTESDDKNQVLYCDSCNTSFHQACYGVEFIEKEEKFFCEVCQFIKRHSSSDKEGNAKLIKKPICQICCKLNFPMRQLNGHFYHITCLVLFDLVEIKNYRIEFKNGSSYEHILQRIVDNEIVTRHCAFCQKETGMKFKCAFPGCNEHFHPICAYLNGVHFELVRSYRSLNSTLTCAAHHPHRDTLNQIYLRRFFCDYKSTSNKTDLEFEEEYKRELQEKASNLALKMKETSLGVMRKGKIAKSYKCSQHKAPRSLNRERSELALSVSKKDSSEIASNPLPPNSENELTDTRRLLRMMSEKNQ